MYYVYILRSIISPTQTYVGFSTNPKERLATHNAGQSSHTKKFKPWSMETYIGLKNEQLAKKFEAYLKTASGIAFRNKRLI
jgi:putative endonuclease